jgi:hypothetical protein
MGVAISRRGPKLVLASLLAGGALVASATAALAWSPPEVTVNCTQVLDTTATSRTFEIPPADCQPAQVPPASSPRTNPPSTPAPSGGGAGTPGLPNTGFDPSD